MARILVEDHAELVELLQAVLEGEGHTVDAVLGGQAALERLEQTVYDRVLCDLAMLEVDGVAVCRDRGAPDGVGRSPHARRRPANARGGVDQAREPRQAPRPTCRRRTAARSTGRSVSSATTRRRK